MTNAIRWGILGTGAISHQFAKQLAQTPGAQLHAVASRQKSNAGTFAHTHGGRACDSYEELCKAPDIDIVYIATPSSLHRDHCMLALGNGKAVLCEKPFTLTAQTATEVAALARKQNLFCMEAMWMRFNPHIQNLKHLLAAGAIGSVRSIRAEVGWAKTDSQDRSREDGGAMLSFGCYALSLSWFLLGPPAGWSARLLKNKHGLDITSGMLLHYPDILVTLAASIDATQSNEILAIGTQGSIRVHAPFIDAVSMDVQAAGISQGRLGRLRIQLAKRYPFLSAPGLLKPGAGFRGEIMESMRCLTGGLQESPVMPLDESIAVHEYLDRIRLSAV